MKSIFLCCTKATLCFVTLFLFALQSKAQTYCTPTYIDGCIFGGALHDFTLTGELGTSFNDLATACCCGTTGGYDDRTSETPVILFIGNTYTMNMDETTFAPGDNVQVWIDFNNDGTFQSTETIAGGAISSTSAPYTTIAIPTPITVPGNYRMRIGISNTQAYPSLSPCATGTSGIQPIGEMVDYIVTIETATTVATCASPTVTLGATTCSSQIINWTAVSGSSGYEYVVNTSSSAPTTGPYTATTATTFTATGLTASTLYYAYVRDSCGAGSFSAWVSTSFTTSAGPAAITGSTTVCPGGTTQLSDATTGGTWSSSNVSAATISATGLVYGAAAGTTNISYTVAGCASGIVVTVAPLPAITGGSTVCPGATTQLSDATAGGVWSSGSAAVATVSGSGLVYGVAAGTTNITYTAGGCTTDIAVTVGALPAITGTTSVCPGSTTHLSDTSPGGVWSSGSTPVATISGGVVYGVSTGTTVITYAIGSCTATATVTVAELPAITGGNTVCSGATLDLSDATSGGVWSSGSATIASVSATGVVTGATAGGTTITYTLGGCMVTLAITVGNTLSAITGTTIFCVTSTTTLSDATGGGVWSSSNVSVATIAGTTVHGVSGGTATISYTEGGCSETTPVTVVPNNGGTITGDDTVCVGRPITLSDAQAGGTWSSSTTSRATVDPGTGVVTGLGVSAGTFTITYTVTNVCGTYTVTRNMHVLTAAECAAGIAPVAEGPNVDLKVFPNPNNGTFTMNLLSAADEEVHVIVSNIVGQKVSEFVTTTNKQVDIKINSTPGIYLFSATTAHGNYIAKVEINTQ